MSCSGAGCTSPSTDLRRVPGRPGGIFCPACRKGIAAEHGRTTMKNKTSEERVALAEAGGNRLLRNLGVQYYASLGRRSAQLRAERRKTVEA